MYQYQPEISTLLLWIQFLTAIIAIAYYKKVKESYWKWFIVYLIYVFLIEKFGDTLFRFIHLKKENYFAFIGIPIEFLFFYWLYAMQSLKSKKIFYSFSFLYFLSFIPVELFFEKIKIVYSFNYTIGSFLLMILVFLEFKKQIQNDDILAFPENKMFYINIGIMLFYVGTLPFFSLYHLLLKEPEIWNIYYLYFLISNCIMYLLFTASFIWGKQKS